MTNETQDKDGKRTTKQRPLATAFDSVQQETPESFFASFLIMMSRIFDSQKDSSGQDAAAENKKIEDLLIAIMGFSNPEEYRSWRSEQESRGWESTQLPGRQTVDTARAQNLLRDEMPASIRRIGNGPASPGERQQRVLNVLDDAAAKTGVSRQFMVGLWGFESNYGRKLVSPTNCQGDFQFTKTTMTEVISKNGADIARHLREQGREEDAAAVLRVHNATKDMNAKQIQSYAARHPEIDSFRNSPEISTYAAAYYVRSVSGQLGLDTNNQSSWGHVYAGYNIGVGNAQRMMRGENVANSREAALNLGDRTSQEAYQRAIEKGAFTT